MRESLESVQLHPDLLAYVVALVAATRTHPQVTVGASPRGTLAVIQLARGHAALAGRAYVTPEDIKAVAVPALAHRLVLRPEMWVRQVTGRTWPARSWPRARPAKHPVRRSFRDRTNPARPPGAAFRGLSAGRCAGPRRPRDAEPGDGGAARPARRDR